MKTITHPYVSIIAHTARTTLATLLLLFISISALAQGSTDGATPSGLAPGSPVGSYPLSEFDVVNLYNGTLNFRMPVLQVAGRGGAGYPITLNIGKKWTVYKHLEPGVGAFYYADSGWWSQETPNAFGAGKVDIRSARREVSFTVVETLTRITFTAPDGTEYELRDQSTNGQPVSPVSGGFNRGTVFVTADGTTATFVSDWNIIDDPTFGQGFYDDRPDGYMVMKDGTRFRVDDGQISWMRDRNGNKVTFGYDSFRRTTSITDSLNRQITIAYPASAPGITTISFKGYGGATRTIKLHQSALENALRTGYTLQTITQLFPGLNGGGPANSIVTSAIELPDGRTYQLRYNPYSELARVVLPTGGAFEYDYEAGLTDGAASGLFTVGTNKYVYRRLTERRIYPTGSSGANFESKITYSRPETTTTNLGYIVAETRNSSNTLLAKSIHYFHGSPRLSFSQTPTQYDAWKDGREYKTEVFDTNGSTILKRTDRTFEQRANVTWWGGSLDAAPPNDPRALETIETIEPASSNLVSKKVFDYDDSVPFNNQNNVKEYGFPSGTTLIRETRTTFVTSSTYTDNSVHLRGLPSQVSVHDATGVERSRTVYEYDNYATDTNHAALTNRANISGFDSSFGTSYTTRGNPTATTQYFLAGGTPTGSIVNYAQYDIAGNVTKAIDGRGYATSMFYTDCFGAPNGEAQTSTDPAELGSTTKTFAFATEVKNALNHSTFAQFDYYLGKPVDGKDANGTVTSSYFNDSLDRATEEKRAVGTSLENRTVFAYDDSSRVITTTTDQTKVSGTVTSTLVNDIRYDQMGRTIEMRQYEGGTNYISTQTQYDTLGRPYKSSNPFRPLQSETAAWTIRAFDALGRVTSVTTPDNAVVTSTYVGATTTAVDETGKQRKQVTDALGRVIEIYEAPDDASLNYLTSYTFDVLDNVTQMTQGAQSRSFVYDSLDRLTSATNPETGQINYQYDNNGNLLVRTDGRGVSTHFEYDALNRVKRQWYNGSSSTSSTVHNSPALPAGVGTTNESKLYYDAESLPGGAPSSFARGFSTGRLVSQVYGTGSNGDYFSYDELGQPTKKFQQVGSQNYEIRATYNASGSVTSITYPSGRKINSDYDTAARLTSLSGDLGDNTTRTYANEITYSAFGSLAKEKFGTTTPVYNKRFYNIRGQLAEIRASTTYTGPTDYSADRGAIVNNFSALCTGICAGSNMTDNNGNLKKQEIHIPGQAVRSQSFTYDKLNRLELASETLTGVGTQWNQKFTYDRYGNRLIDGAVTDGAVNETQFEKEDSTNRLYAPGDLALAVGSRRMQYDGGGNLKHDAYTGGGNRTYDGENRITSAIGNNAQTQTYAYDSSGQRVKRIVNGVETWQVFGFGGELLAEYAADGTTPQKEYGYRNGQLLLTAEAGTTTLTAQNVTWTNGVGVSISGNNLTRTMAGDGWSTGAASTQSITSGDGYVEYTVGETNKTRSVGLTTMTSGIISYQYINYGFYLGLDGQLLPHENFGTYGSYTYATGDKLRVSIEGGVVKFRKNGTLLRTSSVAPTYPLYAGAAIMSNAGTVTGAVITSGPENVGWTSGVGVSISGNNMTRTMAGDGWSTGARSTQSIASGDGYVEYTVGETNKTRSVGLTTATSGIISYQYINYGFYLGLDGQLLPHEGFGTYGSYTYATGDKLRVSIEGGVVKFRKNGTLLRTSSVAPTYPLYAGGAIMSNAGTVTGAIISLGGESSAPAQFRWMVSDHLGTPRMILDQTGDLANMKRHDYLPFGEELFAPIGQRNASFGYGTGDNVRQQFTEKERDVETGLDYFGARFYASVQGRFVSPDPAAPDMTDPQSLNKYVYCFNNPLRFTDPTGEYGDDVHRDLTKVLAFAAGFTQAQAQIIGDNTQDSDDDPKKSPARLSDLRPWGNPVTKRALWHFTTPQRLGEMWSIFENSAADSSNKESDDFMRLGEYLHALQDSYSHAGWGPRVGQVPSAIYDENGKIQPKSPARVDETDYNPNKVTRMAQKTFEQLLKARDKMKTKEKRKPVPWSLISPLVSEFANAKDRRTKNDILRRLSNIIVDYVAMGQRGKGCFGQGGRRIDEFGQ